MLADKDAAATIAVKDIQVARKFYAETLGLEQVGSEGDEAIIFSAGRAQLFVYRSKFAGTNQATTVTWSVGQNIFQIVDWLKQRGVKFEHYDMPGMKLEGDVHVAERMKAAWFKDPDGNILNLAGA
jgi:extradiol dioxygenase family protein